MGSLISSWICILLIFQEWCCGGVYALDIDCTVCPEERNVKDKDGFISLDGCQQADVRTMTTNCEVCATTIAASEVIVKAKNKDDNADASVTLTEGWVLSRGCAAPSAKPGSCEYKGKAYVCYCNEPLCNMMPPPCTWLLEANKKIPDPKGCMDIVDGKSVYTMEYTVHTETSETSTFTEEKVNHHRGVEKKQHASAATGGGNGCARFGSNKKQCRTNGCEFNVVEERCQESGPCSGLKGIRYCPRPGVFYLNGGVICRSTAQDGDGCPPLQVVVATKVLLKEGQTKADSRGVVYKHEIVDEDPLNTRTADDQSFTKCSLDLQSRYSEMSLYLPAIYGNPNRIGSGACLTYSIPVLTDGDYEFSMKFMEYFHTDSKTKRGFFINLETLDSSTDLVYDLDVFHYVGSCAPLDLIVNMKVSKSRILLQGFEEMTYRYKYDKLSLSFCYGEDAPDPQYILSAFYVAKLRADCSTYGKDKVACKNAQCEFNLGKGQCENRKKCNFDESLKTQLRGGGYYANGGSICFNEKQEKSGPAINVVMATKVLLEKGQSVTDSRGVLYLPDTDNYEDPHNTRVVDWTNLQKCDLETILPAADREVYYPSIYGRTAKRDTKGCISFPLPTLDSDGNYEISLKFLEYFYSNSNTVRGFSVRLQNSAGKELEILYELNVFSYAGNCNPLEILVLMKLSGSKLSVQGFPDFDIGGDKKMKLAFCYGDSASTDSDPNYLVSSFYLAKLTQDCSSHGKDRVACRAAECEVNTAQNTCENKRSCDSKPELGNRLRARSFYLDGGTLSYNKEPKGNVLIAETITAQKVGLEKGKNVNDSNGITYEHETTLEDPLQLRSLVEDNIADCRSANFPVYEDRAIYDSAMYSNGQKSDSKNCLFYNIPKLTSDGSYELVLRTIETKWQDRFTARNWNVRFNCGQQSLDLLYQLNIFSYAGYCTPMDIVVLFNLLQGTLTVQGFSGVPYRPGDKLQIALCYGEKLKGVGDVNFVLSAFHVAKYAASCTTIGDKRGDCKRAGCEVNTVTMLCEDRKTACDESLNLGGSLRSNVFFAVSGILCYNEKQRGPPLNPKQIVAVKLGHGSNVGYPFIDRRGIVYEAEKNYEDFDRIRNAVPTHCLYDHVFPVEDRIFFTKFLHGRSVNDSRTGCVSYPIPPLKEDGDYEISLKFFQKDFFDSGAARVFLHAGNDKLLLLYDLNSFNYMKRFCRAMEVVQPMQLLKGKLTVKGFPNVISLNGQEMKLSFCCGETSLESKFKALSFHVARLTPNCATYGENKRKCKENNCEFNIAKATCQNRKPCEVDGRLGERLRGQVFYADGGTLCYNHENRGYLSHEKVLKATKVQLESDTATDLRGVVFRYRSSLRRVFITGGAGNAYKYFN